jgi:hypothetical protein
MKNKKEEKLRVKLHFGSDPSLFLSLLWKKRGVSEGCFEVEGAKRCISSRFHAHEETIQENISHHQVGTMLDVENERIEGSGP